MFHNKKRSILFNQTSYITSETYHALNQNNSEIYIIKSTSTLFYDLDTLAKRHSYHFVPEYPISERRKIAKKKIEISHKNAFGAKSETIVQECATQIKPKLKRQDSLKIAAKKIKKRSFNDSMLSSEIFLRDNDYTKRKSESFIKHNNELRQKFWSYAKYQTQYTNPLSEIKKCKKNNRGKRTEDPCPCQLFSYACPCTDKKSLTELAKNSKSLTVADQITSTPNFLQQGYQKYGENKKSKCSSFYEDKPTNTNITEFTNQYEMAAVYEEPIINKKEIPKFREDKSQNITSFVKNGIKVESQPHKKSKRVICPNCKETLEILSTDDEDSLKSKRSLNYHVNQNASPVENQNYKNSNIDQNDTCIHDPPCELVPVCQILPTDNINYNGNPNCVRRVSVTKHNPKTIRITKACRHHPPCIVVPSCQRLNVLKNNCEFIPPCLHRPRCVNVPLCVPCSRSVNCEGILNKKVDDPDFIECAYFPPNKMISAYKQKSPNNSYQTCEYVSECSPRFILNPQMQGSPTISPYNRSNNSPCLCCKLSKSCQYDCVGCNCIARDEVKECVSNDDIIYIRDVGCQFRSENFAQKDSLLQSKTSSASFDLTNAKAGNYYSNYHTLRYEDKCTCPISGEGEVSLSALTTSSLEIDAQCPSRGIQACKQRDTGFKPQSTASPFVAAFSTYKDPILQCQHIISDEISQVTSKSDSVDMLTYLTTFPVKSRRSFLKGKRKKVFSIRRRRKSNRNNTSHSTRIINNI